MNIAKSINILQVSVAINYRNYYEEEKVLKDWRDKARPNLIWLYLILNESTSLRSF